MSLEFEPRRLETGLAQRLAHRGQEMAIAQLHRRDVDRHGEPPALLPPEPCLPARLAQHPRPEWTDQGVGLGQRDELVWQQQPALGVVPADQRLGTGEAAAAKIKLRLVVQYELAALQRQAQLTLQPSTRLRLRVHVWFEEGEPVPALRLGAVEREVGVASSASPSAPSHGNRAMPMLAVTWNVSPSIAQGTASSNSSLSASVAASAGRARRPGQPQTRRRPGEQACRWPG